MKIETVWDLDTKFPPLLLRSQRSYEKLRLPVVPFTISTLFACKSLIVEWFISRCPLIDMY
jgi:hypothetical protein